MAKTTATKSGQVVTHSVTAKVGQPATVDAAGAALASSVITLAHEASKEAHARQNKLRDIAKRIHALTHDGHLTFRRDIETERKNVREELNRIGYSANVHRVHGTSAATWFVYASNFIGLSKAMESGMTPYMDDGKTVHDWSSLLAISTEIRGSKGKAGPTKRKQGKTLAVDKVIGYAARLDVEGLQSLAVWVKNALKAQ